MLSRHHGGILGSFGMTNRLATAPTSWVVHNIMRVNFWKLYNATTDGRLEKQEESESLQHSQAAGTSHLFEFFLYTVKAQTLTLYQSDEVSVIRIMLFRKCQNHTESDTSWKNPKRYFLISLTLNLQIVWQFVGFITAKHRPSRRKINFSSLFGPISNRECQKIKAFSVCYEPMRSVRYAPTALFGIQSQFFSPLNS